MKCANCSAELDPGEKFCGECGQPIQASAAPAAVTGTAQPVAPRSSSSSFRIALIIGVVAFVAMFLLGSVGIGLWIWFGARATTPSIVGTEIKTASGLRYTEISEGAGPSPRVGQIVSVHYTGTLENGTKFDSSLDRGKPFEFRIGTGAVIRGWDEGLMSMKVGGKRRLIIPPSLAYGPLGSPPKIPSNATLIFDVELLSVK